LAGLLVGTITLKVLYSGLNEQVPFDLAARVGAVLRTRGFFVRQLPMNQTLFQSLVAELGSCRLTVAAISPLGWERETIKRMATPQDQVSFIYKGHIYPEQPAWRTWLDFYLSRAARLVGLRGPLAPVFGVIADPTCQIDEVRGLIAQAAQSDVSAPR